MRKLHLTAKGLEEYGNLPYLQKRIVEVLSEDDLTLTNMVKQVRLKYHEYRYVELKVYMSALAFLIREEVIIYNE